MTGQDFINRIEKFFGKYDNDFIKNAVIKFVVENWKVGELQDLLNYTITHFSTQYKAQPDVYFFNKIWDDRNSGTAEEKAEEAWTILEKELKTDRSLLCTDIIMQETIISMGGVNQFLDYRMNQHNWCKKAFIETYINKSKSEGIYKKDFQIIKNDAQIQYPKYPPELFYRNDVKVIGDQAQGKEMLIEMEKDLAIEYKHGEVISIKDVMDNLKIGQ